MLEKLQFLPTYTSESVLDNSKVSSVVSPVSAMLSGFFFFFYPGFLSQPFTNHRTAGEGGRHCFNSSLPLLPASQTIRH